MSGKKESTKTAKKKSAKKSSKKMGRPRIEIDNVTFENLCHLQCTLAEIAQWFKCSEDTVERWCKRNYGMTFADAYKKYSAGGRISLRRTQFRLAEKSASMAIFLGKQYLGQRDVLDQRVNFDDDGADLEIYIPDNGRRR